MATRDTYFSFYAGCRLRFAFDIPIDGTYHVEAVVWADQAGDESAKLTFGSILYEEGDTWYRDMRIPGFNGSEALHPDNSLQWLAKQIVADERFAEATVEFWWPAIMGSEVAEPPEDASDTDFEGLLLAANAQGAEVERLANGFQRGFPGSPYKYNLKDLLVEIVLSDWFRADAVTDTDPVRRVALRDAGTRRMLTPEELARKTASITGVQWGREIGTSCWPICERHPNLLAGDYRLLYGGIDSGWGHGAGARHDVGDGRRSQATCDDCELLGRGAGALPAAGCQEAVVRRHQPDVTSADAIKGKLVGLHDKLLGVQVTAIRRTWRLPTLYSWTS